MFQIKLWDLLFLHSHYFDPCLLYVKAIQPKSKNLEDPNQVIYSQLGLEEPVVYARNNTEGLALSKTEWSPQAFLIEADAQEKQCATITELSEGKISIFFQMHQVFPSSLSSENRSATQQFLKNVSINNCTEYFYELLFSLLVSKKIIFFYYFYVQNCTLQY